MALSEIGKQSYELYLQQNDHVYAIVVKDKITLTREKNAASKLTLSVYRSVITPEVGDALALTLDGGHQAFYGYIISTSKSGPWCDVVAYDQLYYMNRNKSRMGYQNLTAAEVAVRVCRERQYNMLDPPMFADTKYKIPYRIEENVSDLTIITTALDLTFQNTGWRYYVWDDFGSLTISHDGDLAATSNVYVTRKYIEDYKYEETLDDVYTAARVEKTITDYGSRKTKDDNKTTIETYTARNEEFIKKYGFLEGFETADEKENGQNKAGELMISHYPPNLSLSLTGVQGEITVRGGTPILVDFFTGERAEFIRGWYTVESVTHTIQDGYHKMDITASLLVPLHDWNNTDPSYYSYPWNSL